MKAYLGMQTVTYLRVNWFVDNVLNPNAKQVQQEVELGTG